MLINVHCKKCGENSKLDIGDWGREQVEKWLKQDDGFHCFGYHVELGSRADYWELDWDNMQEGNAPSEEEFLSQLQKENVEVYTTEQLQEIYEVQGFQFGLVRVKNKESGIEKVMSYVASPKGTRYYIA